MVKHKILYLFIILVVILVVTQCIFSCRKEDGGESRKPAVIIVKVKDRIINRDEFEKMFREDNPELAGKEEGSYYYQILKKEYAYKIANELMLIAFASESGIGVTDKEVYLEIGKIKEGYTQESFDEMLKIEGINMAALGESIRKRLLLKKVLDEKVYGDITVSDEETADYYQKFKNSFYKPEEYKFDQISFQGEEEAKEVYEQLRSGKMDFTMALEKYSHTAEPLNVGAAGYIPKSGLPEEFEIAIEGLMPGDITVVIPTNYGYHILKLLEKTEKRYSEFEEVREKIIRIIREQKERTCFSRFIEDYMKREQVFIKDDYFRSEETAE